MDHRHVPRVHLDGLEGALSRPLRAPRLMKVLLFVVAMCHWSACLFWVIGRPESLMTDLCLAEVKPNWPRGGCDPLGFVG